MADISPEGIKQSYQIACDLYSQKQYGECRKLLKICIQVNVLLVPFQVRISKVRVSLKIRVFNFSRIKTWFQNCLK